jgi:hypothetical protein
MIRFAVILVCFVIILHPATHVTGGLFIMGFLAGAWLGPIIDDLDRLIKNMWAKR